MAKKKSLIPGFSLNRALGVSSAKQKIARMTGIPTTAQGRKRKLERMTFNAITASIAYHEAKKMEKSINAEAQYQRFSEYVNEKMARLNSIAENMRAATVLSVFFSYIDAYLDTLDEMIDAGCPDGYQLNPLPSDVKKQFLLDMPERINKALDRAWMRWQEEALTLKTEKGKKNRIIAFFQMVALYNDRFSPDNQEKIKEIKEVAKVQYGIEEIT